MSTKLHENYASVQSTSDTKTTLSMCCVNSLSAVDCICFLSEYCTPDSPLLPPPFFSLLLCFHQQHGFPFDSGQDSHCREHLSTNVINQCKLTEKSVLKSLYQNGSGFEDLSKKLWIKTYAYYRNTNSTFIQVLNVPDPATSV